MLRRTGTTDLASGASVASAAADPRLRRCGRLQRPDNNLSASRTKIWNHSAVQFLHEHVDVGHVHPHVRWARRACKLLQEELGDLVLRQTLEAGQEAHTNAANEEQQRQWPNAEEHRGVPGVIQVRRPPEIAITHEYNHRTRTLPHAVL